MGKNEAMNLADLLSESAGRHPEKKALLIPGSPGRAPVTYKQLDAEVDRVASSIQALGLAPGDRVAISMNNVPEFLFAYFGSLRAGAVVVPLNIMLTEPELARILSDSEAKVVFASDEATPIAVAAGRSAESVQKVFTVEAWDELASKDGKATSMSREPDDLAVLAYTSGTT